MSTFKITWSTGKSEVCEQESATTVEEFCNIHFGSAWAEAQAAGVTVEPYTEPEPELPLGDPTNK